MASPKIFCPRCGVERTTRYGREYALCRDCRLVNAEMDQRDGLAGGHWQKNRGGVQVWVKHFCHCGAPLVGPSCDTCLVWAEKDARLHAEARQSWANRGVIWDVLAARKEREDAA